MSTELSTKLNSAERSKWRTLRPRCQSRMAGMWELIADLRVIRDEKLYREDFNTFDSFVRDELGLERTYAYRLIDAAETKERLSTIVDKNPEVESIQSEWQLKELKNVPDCQLAEVVEKAAVIASDLGKPMTAAILRQAREEVLEQSEEPEVEPAAVEMSPAEMAVQNASVGREILNAISGVMKLVRDVPEATGTERLRNCAKSVLNDLQNARNAVSVSMPAGVCPRCKGVGCIQCGNMGWVNSVLMKELEA